MDNNQVEIVITKRYTDLQLMRTVEPGEVLVVSKDRKDVLAKLGLVKGAEDQAKPFARIRKFDTTPPLKTPDEIKKELMAEKPKKKKKMRYKVTGKLGSKK